MRTPIPTIIPAQPGWFRMWVSSETGALFGSDPVMAWEVVPREYSEPAGAVPPYFIEVFPVTTGGRVDAEDVFLLRPDGKVEELFIGEWDNLGLANAPEECARRVENIGARRAERRQA
jgi:hypothetical protein